MGIETPVVFAAKLKEKNDNNDKQDWRRPVWKNNNNFFDSMDKQFGLGTLVGCREEFKGRAEVMALVKKTFLDSVNFLFLHFWVVGKCVIIKYKKKVFKKLLRRRKTIFFANQRLLKYF